MNITKQQYSQPIGHFHRGGGKLPDHYSSTVSVGSILLYHVSAHLPIPVFVNNLHSRQQVHVVSVFAVDNLVCESHQYTRIHKAFEGVRGSQEQACDRCQPIIHTYI